jgi:multidrug resistance efflux pump
MVKQKLSPKAAADKKERDLAFAKNQRKRRAAIKAGKNISGKDYDHKTKRFTSIKSNRGNRGHGTKRE